MLYYSSNAYGNCKCGKQLTESQFKNNGNLCYECSFHQINGTDTIKKYNEWLKKEKK